jgi:hypothetical protein
MNIATLKSNKGFTLLEMVIAVASMLMAMTVMFSMFAGIIRYWTLGFSATCANSDAAIAMRALVADMQEGSSAVISNGGNTLTVTFSYRPNSNSDYTRGQPGDVATYYFSGPTGQETTGSMTYLWKSVGATRTLLGKNVMPVDASTPVFSITTTRLVQINFKGQEQEGAVVSPNLIQQSVRLRNS